MIFERVYWHVPKFGFGLRQHAPVFDLRARGELLIELNRMRCRSDR